MGELRVRKIPVLLHLHKVERSTCNCLLASSGVTYVSFFLARIVLSNSSLVERIRWFANCNRSFVPIVIDTFAPLWIISCKLITFAFMIRLSPIGSYCYWLFDESKVKARLNRMQLSALVRISILNHTNFKAKKRGKYQIYLLRECFFILLLLALSLSYRLLKEHL